MESLLASSSVATTFRPPPFPSPSPVLRSAFVASGSAAARGVSCNAAKSKWRSMSYSPLCDEEALFNSKEVFQWEGGMSLNAILAAQGIRIRRQHRNKYPSEASNGPIPRNILEQIIWDKEVEVHHRKAMRPLDDVIELARHAPPARDFIGALDTAHRRNSVPALIAEVKKASPTRGLLREDFNPVEIAQAYEENGAACLSIVTDERHFQGSFEHLETVRNAGVKCPILCKEFILDLWQVYYARAKGADAVLLMASVLPDLDINYMLRTCKELGMTALVEVQDEKELDRVLNIKGVDLIGINNRNLETFEVDTANTKRLLEKRRKMMKKKGILVVGESGLFTPQDIKFVHDNGVSAVLVGESLLTEDDPGEAITELYGKELMC